MKTKALLFILFIVAAYSYSYGQSYGRTSLGVELGLSIPFGDYASNDAGQFSDSAASYPGFAKTGMVIRLVFEHRLTHSLGIQADFMFGYNNLDQIAMGDSLGNKIDADLSLSATRPWNLGGLMVGPFLRIPFTEEFSMIIRGKVGGIGVYSPEYKIVGTSNEDQSKLEYYQYVDNTFAFIWSAGGGFQYRLENYTLNLYGDYFGMNADFIDVTGQDWSQKPPVETSYSFRQKINALTITFGVSYVF